VLTTFPFCVQLTKLRLPFGVAVTAVALPAPDATPTTPTTTAQPSSVTLDAVKPVSLAEEMDDEIPW
jgi:hypothetical protein